MIRFAHPESDSIYSLLHPQGDYNHILPVKSVDIHGVTPCPNRSRDMIRELGNDTIACFPMAHLLTPPDHFSTKYTDLNHSAGAVGNCFETKTP